MQDWRAWAVKAAEWGADYRARLRELPVRPPVKPGEIAAQIADAPPETAEPFEQIFADFEHTIVPGMIDTPLVTHTIAQRGDRGSADELHAQARRLVPMGERGTAWDVAYASLYLASDEARYTTGTEILVDGGFMANTGRAR